MANAGKLEWPPRENWMSSKVGDWRTGHKQLEPDDTQFLRADTCTPNEECVSKAELEQVDKWLENGRVNCLGTPLGNPNKDYDDGKAAGFSLALTMLREVMDK